MKREHEVKLQDNFLFSKTEVTHKQYRACVESGDCSLPQIEVVFRGLLILMIYQSTV